MLILKKLIEARRKGLVTAMSENLVAELGGREFEAVETFARKSSKDDPSGPLELYLKHGFKIKMTEKIFHLCG